MAEGSDQKLKALSPRLKHRSPQTLRSGTRVQPRGGLLRMCFTSWISFAGA